MGAPPSLDPQLPEFRVTLPPAVNGPEFLAFDLCQIGNKNVSCSGHFETRFKDFARMNYSPGALVI